MSKNKKRITLDDLNNNNHQIKANPIQEQTTTVEPAKEKPVVIRPNQIDQLDEKTRIERQARANSEPEVIMDLTTIAAKPAPTVPPEQRNMNNLMNRVDDSIERAKEDIKTNVMEPLKENLMKQVKEKVQKENEEEIVGIKNGTIKPDPIREALKIDTEDEDEKLLNSVVNGTPIIEKEDKEEDTSLLDTTAAIPGESFKEEVKSAPIDFTKPVETDDEMKELLKEIDDDGNDADTEDLSTLNEEERKVAEDWEKQQINDYRANLRNKLETSGRVEKSHGELKIAKVPISVSKALRQSNQEVVHTASFPLIHTGRMITMQSLIGDEIPVLDARGYNSELEASRAIYSLLYKKDVSPNKPNNFELWLKSIADWDVYNMYMCAYIATFKDSNYISYNCPECHNMFIVEQPIESMYRKHPEASKDFDDRVKAIKEKGDNSVPSALTSTFIRISSRYGIGMRAPSIFSSTFETSAIDNAFRRKHIQCVNLSQYIDGVYYINDGIATPIDFKIDKHDTTKTVKMKIISIEKILSTLTTDEAAALAGKLATFNQKAVDRFQFVIPAAKCEGKYGPYKDKDGKSILNKKCDKEIEEITMRDRETEVSPLDLLFTRHRLTQFAFYETES